jgi:hypothetical protein
MTTDKQESSFQLYLSTPYGNHYRIEANGNIVRLDIPGFKPSGEWRFLGLKSVRTRQFIPFASLTPEKVAQLNYKFKNGKPRWTVRDWDHGAIREWGNTDYHGVASLCYQKRGGSGMKRSLNFICGKWHAWDGTAGVLLSDEDTKTLRSFPTVDDCITWLYGEGERIAARALNIEKNAVNG